MDALNYNLFPKIKRFFNFNVIGYNVVNFQQPQKVTVFLKKSQKLLFFHKIPFFI